MLKDIAVNINAKLTSDVRKALAIVIEQEFNNKASLFQVAKENEREKILDAYRKSIGYDTLFKTYTKANDKLERAGEEHKRAEKAITDMGLQIDGEMGTEYSYNHISQKREQNIKVKELREKLSVIEDNAPMSILKAKLITRLMLATTIGEANAVMYEVLGNGVIPNVNAKQITYSA